MFPVAGSAVLPRRRPVRAQRPRPRPDEHLPGPGRCSSPTCARRASTTRTCSFRAPSWSSKAARAGSRRPTTTHSILPFRDKAAYLAEYRADWDGWLAAERASWVREERDLVADLAQWFEPLMERAPITSRGHRRQRRARAHHTVGHADGLRRPICLDFVERKVRAAADEPFVYRIDRRPPRSSTVLVEDHVEDWVNSLFLSCRFRGVAAGTVQRVRDDVLQSARS